MNEPAMWLRPRTTRRYLHPPKSQHMYTFWAEGKLILGEITPCIDWRSYPRLDCCGLWLTHGTDDQAFDFHLAGNLLPKDGTPIHTLIHPLDSLSVEMEAFCNIDRKPACFVKISVTNQGKTPVEEPFAIFLRSGKEKELVFGSPDEYTSYAPDLNVWKQAPVTWRPIRNTADPKEAESALFMDETAFLTASGHPVTWDETVGAVRFTASLNAGESLELILSFGKGKPVGFDYREEQELVFRFWERELGRICKLPTRIYDYPEVLEIIQNLTVQMLQCFCFSVGNAATAGKEVLIPRQGGLQRLIWPWEATAMLEALGQIGDFSDYIESAISMYFEVLQAPNGEIRPAGEGWANITASALYSYARYSLDVRSSFYYCYREEAMAAFDWIRKTRASSAALANGFAGLFPPKRATDWGQEFQAWLSTDIVNVRGLIALADAADKFRDPRAGEIRKEAEDYRAVLQSLVHRYEEEAKATGILRIPLSPDGNDGQLLKEFYPYFNFGRFPALQIIEDANIDSLLNFLKSEGIYQHGLYGHMPYPDGNLHIWYTTNPEYYWFLAWMRLGRKDMAKEILESMYRYSMTDEFYMIERYSDNDPWYVPWSPNASGNGRMIIMLLKYMQDIS